MRDLRGLINSKNKTKYSVELIIIIIIVYYAEAAQT